MDTLRGLSVLLLEDEYLIALDAEQILRDLGVETVETVASYEAAEKRAHEGQFDVAILDVNINGKFSYPIASAIRERGIPFIFASGYEMHDRTAPGLEDALCVTKPYTSARLMAALAAALDDTQSEGAPPARQ